MMNFNDKLSVFVVNTHFSARIYILENTRKARWPEVPFVCSKRNNANFLNDLCIFCQNLGIFRQNLGIFCQNLGIFAKSSSDLLKTCNFEQF